MHFIKRSVFIVSAVSMLGSVAHAKNPVTWAKNGLKRMINPTSMLNPNRKVVQRSIIKNLESMRPTLQKEVNTIAFAATGNTLWKTDKYASSFKHVGARVIKRTPQSWTIRCKMAWNGSSSINIPVDVKVSGDSLQTLKKNIDSDVRWQRKAYQVSKGRTPVSSGHVPWHDYSQK